MAKVSSKVNTRNSKARTNKVNKRKDDGKKVGILVAILLLAIGFATVTTTLYINGSAILKQDEQNFIDGVVFDEDSIQTDGIADYEIVDDGRVINMTLGTMKDIGDEATLTYKIRNDSQYIARIKSVDCYFVDDFETGKTKTPRVYTNEYITIAPSQAIVNAVILPNGNLSGDATIYAKQIKSYVGDKNNIDTDKDGELDALEIKFQCEIIADAEESN